MSQKTQSHHEVQCPTEVSAGPRMDFLRKLLAAPGVLSGLDLISGEVYSTVVHADSEEFLRAHVLGPAGAAAPRVDVTTLSGEQRRVRTFVRSMVLPTTGNGECTHVAVRFKTKNSLLPSELIIAASLALHRAGITHYYVERSVLTGVWVIWILLGDVVERQYVESLARRVREILKNVGIVDGDYLIPLLEAEPTALHLPCMFFSGAFFGVLFEVDEEGCLHEVDPTQQVYQDSVASSEDAPQAGLLDPSRSMDGLLERWSSRHGAKAVRAGELAAFARQEGVLPLSLSTLPPQAAAIALGRELLALVQTATSRFVVVPSRSGNSNVFRIEARQGAEVGAP